MSNQRKYTVSCEMTWEQIDKIVVDDLKLAINLNLAPRRDEGGEFLDIDEDLVDAIMTVLSYYMTASEFTEYEKEVSLRRQSTAQRI